MGRFWSIFEKQVWNFQDTRRKECSVCAGCSQNHKNKRQKLQKEEKGEYLILRRLSKSQFQAEQTETQNRVKVCPAECETSKKCGNRHEAFQS